MYSEELHKIIDLLKGKKSNTKKSRITMNVFFDTRYIFFDKLNWIITLIMIFLAFLMYLIIPSTMKTYPYKEEKWWLIIFLIFLSLIVLLLVFLMCRSKQLHGHNNRVLRINDQEALVEKLKKDGCFNGDILQCLVDEVNDLYDHSKIDFTLIISLGTFFGLNTVFSKLTSVVTNFTLWFFGLSLVVIAFILQLYNNDKQAIYRYVLILLKNIRIDSLRTNGEYKKANNQDDTTNIHKKSANNRKSGNWKKKKSKSS